MDRHDTDTLFGGSVAQVYDTYLVPLIFEPYAVDLAGRVASRHPKGVLEIAAGTGVVTRAMSAALPDNAAIVATDLNQPMLDRASAVGTPTTGRVAPSGCAATTLRRRNIRCGCVPVRRHVLPR